jgi:hypothetical protein
MTEAAQQHVRDLVNAIDGIVWEAVKRPIRTYGAP